MYQSQKQIRRKKFRVIPVTVKGADSFFKFLKVPPFSKGTSMDQWIVKDPHVGDTRGQNLENIFKAIFVLTKYATRQEYIFRE
jgi:hypothetical protein